MMTGFEWPFQVAKISGDTGRVRDRLTTSPVIFGNASVAVTTHVLPATAALLRTTSSVAEAANIVRFRIRPFRRLIAKLEHRKFSLSIGRQCGAGALTLTARVTSGQSVSMAPTSASATIVPFTLASP